MTTRAPRKSGGGASKKAPPAPGQGLAAELKALGDAHGEIVAQRNRLFGALLGIGGSADKPSPPPLFKLPSFEDLFDDRVARALERLGTTESLAQLQAQLAAIDKRLRQLERATASARRAPPPRAKR
jgi:hypothetical protein